MYLLTNVCFDTAENEPLNILYFRNFLKVEILYSGIFLLAVFSTFIFNFFRNLYPGSFIIEFWAGFGLRDAALADGCDTATPGACCYVPQELGDALHLCEAALVAESGLSRPSGAACANAGRRGIGRLPRKCKLRGPRRATVG